MLTQVRNSNDYNVDLILFAKPWKIIILIIKMSKKYLT